MTAKRAINILKKLQATPFNGIKNDIALDMAITALAKQIPKKPDYEGDGYDANGNLIYDTWICPNCGKHYEVDYDDYNFCPECGQALDWSDYNDL